MLKLWVLLIMNHLDFAMIRGDLRFFNIVRPEAGEVSLIAKWGMKRSWGKQSQTLEGNSPGKTN